LNSKRVNKNPAAAPGFFYSSEWLETNMPSSSEGDAAEGDCQIAVANIFLDAFLRMGVECAHADVDPVDIARIADTAIDDNTFPAVLLRQNGKLVANQRAAHGAAAINDQHLASAILGKGRAHKRIVLEQLERDDLAAEGLAAAVELEHRGDNTNAGAEFGLKLVAEIGGFESHAGSL
jgi:hypothetical protein